jgi:hypothetical protein
MIQSHRKFKVQQQQQQQQQQHAGGGGDAVAGGSYDRNQGRNRPSSRGAGEGNGNRPSNGTPSSGPYEVQSQAKGGHVSGIVRSLAPLFPRISREQLWFVVKRVSGQRDKALQVLLLLSGEEGSTAGQKLAISSRLLKADRNETWQGLQALGHEKKQEGYAEGPVGNANGYRDDGRGAAPNLSFGLDAALDSSELQQVNTPAGHGSTSFSTPPTTTHANTRLGSGKAVVRSPQRFRPSRGAPWTHRAKGLKAKGSNAKGTNASENALAKLQAQEFAQQAKAFAQQAAAFDTHEEHDDGKEEKERIIRLSYPDAYGTVVGLHTDQELHSDMSWQGDVLAGPLGSGGF